MDKRTKRYILLIVVLLIGVIIIEMNRKEPVDWSPTFINTDKNPFGTYILFDLLPEVFPGQDIRVSRRPIYNQLNYIDDYDSYKKKNEDNKNTSYIFINQNFGISSYYGYGSLENFGTDELDIETLFGFVEDGNNVFIAAEDMNALLLDSLGIEIENAWASADTTYLFKNIARNKEYSFTGVRGGKHYFVTDSCKFEVTTLAEGKSDRNPVFINVKFGAGNFYLNSIPAAFSNIELLNLKKYDFAFTCLSYLPKNNNIIWDEYQKQGRVGEYSTFRVIWNHPALLYAYYIILAGGLLFMIFRSKRMQRIIPVIKPPANTSLEFLDTVSNLYYQKQAYESIVVKRHAYFLDMVRTKYYLSTETIDSDFIETLSLKSGVNKDVIEHIFALYDKMRNTYDISNSMLISYNDKLEEFYRNMK